MENDELNEESCTFCAELIGRLDKSNYGRLTGQTKDARVLWQNNEFALIPSIGPLVEDHLLLIPTYHAFSFADLSEYVLSRADHLIMSLANYFLKQGCQIVVFEHGAKILDGSDYEKRLKRAICGACTDHAHFHLLPTISSHHVISEMESRGLHLKKSGLLNLNEFPQKVDRETAYIIIRGSNMEAWGLYLFEEIPSQFMREIVASIIGLKGWDWSEFPRIHLVQKTVRLLGPRIRVWLRNTQ